MAFILLTGAWLPEAARAANAIKNQNPCGMLVCCCPEMCKRARQAKLRCLEDRDRCGGLVRNVPVRRTLPYSDTETRDAESILLPVRLESGERLAMQPLVSLPPSYSSLPERPPSA